LVWLRWDMEEEKGSSSTPDHAYVVDDDDDDEEEEEEDEYIGPRAFKIDGELGPEAGPPLDGFDYLRRVRWEAKRVPKVVRSNINPRHYDSLQTTFLTPPPDIAECPDALRPSTEWESTFLAGFEALRKDLAHRYQTQPKPPLAQPLPAIKDAQRWKQINLGISQRGSTTSQPAREPARPTLSVIMNLDIVSVRQLLEYHLRWAKKAKEIDEVHAQWLYALMLRLDKPIDADMASGLRSLLRRLASDRARLAESPDDPALPALNILITIICKCFGQGGS